MKTVIEELFDDYGNFSVSHRINQLVTALESLKCKRSTERTMK